MERTDRHERKHIVFVGKKNAGKSSLINLLAGQDFRTTGDMHGSSTCKINNQMDFFSYGPILLIDTAGIDRTFSEKGNELNNTVNAITNADFVVVVLDARDRLLPEEFELLKYIKKISLSFIIAINKIEYGVNPLLLTEIKWMNAIHYEISCAENVGIENLKRKIIRMLPESNNPKILGDIVNQGDVIILLIPSEADDANKKIILTQIRAIKEALDEDSIVIVVKDIDVRSVFYALKNPPDLVVADNDSIERVVANIPDSIKITTYSILTARYKGGIKAFIQGLNSFDSLNDGDKILIAEACPHHPKGDITGIVTIPEWIKESTKKQITFDYNRGEDLPANVSDYRLIIHCEGCLLSRHAMIARIRQAAVLDIPIINYGIFHSYIHGALPRALEPFNATLEHVNPN